LLSQSSDISVYRLLKIKRKMVLFRGNDVGTTMMNPSLGAATTGSSVLEAMIKKKESSLYTIYCLNPLISPSTAESTNQGENGEFGELCRPKRAWWSDLSNSPPVGRVYVMQW